MTGFVQPGAGIRNVITVAKSGTSKLTKKRHAHYWGGTNNVSQNTTAKTINQLFSF